MSRLTRNVALLALLVLPACTPSLVNFLCPPLVRAGAVFEVVITADSTFSPSLASGGDAGCVLQIPNGFTVLGEQIVYDKAFSLTRNSPALLAGYTAEPGHYLASWVGTDQDQPVSQPGGRIVLKIYLQAPATAGSAGQLKVAMVGGSPGAWTAEQPAGITQFAAITAAPFVQSLAVGAVAVTDFEIDPASVPFGSWPNRTLNVAFDDLDGDGDDDLVGEFVHAGPGFRAWLAAPGLPWRERSGGLSGGLVGEDRRVAFGDFDGDGARDVARADGGVFFGNGGQSWSQAAPFVGGNTRSVAAGDVNGDGRDDLLFLGSSSGGVQLFHGNTNRTFTLANNGLPASGLGLSTGVLLADLTGNGVLDAYIADSVTSNVWVNDGSGNWTAGLGVASLARFAVVGDLDGDAVPELVRFGSNLAQGLLGMEVYAYQGASTWAPLAGTGLPTTMRFPGGALLDFDADGDLDLVVGLDSGALSGATDGVQVWRNDGSAQFSLHSGSGLSGLGRVLRVAAGDFDGDQRPDLAVEFATKQTVFYRNATAQAVTRVPGGCGEQAITAIGDGSQGSSLLVHVTDTVGIALIGYGVQPGSLPVCAGCSLGHEWAVTEVGPTAALVVPVDPGLVGVTVGIQAADVFATIGCLGLPVTFSDTLVLTIP